MKKSRNITLIIILLIVGNSFFAEESQRYFDNKYSTFKPVVERLLAEGADSAFVYSIINHPNSKFDERYVKINVSGYLNPPDYSSQYNELSVNRTRRFLNDNYDLLSKAEKEYGVPKEILASILWIETRHGNYLGNHNIVSVYLSAAMCNLDEYYNLNKKIFAENFSGEKSELIELEERLSMRSEKKSNWAIEQLLALEKMYNHSSIPIYNIKGSWAGAFGISQFLPSSFVNWAVDGNNDGVINLFDLEDAVFSTANYLKQNGWGETIDDIRAAIFHYNNSNDYVDAVITLADYISEK